MPRILPRNIQICVLRYFKVQSSAGSRLCWGKQVERRVRCVVCEASVRPELIT